LFVEVLLYDLLEENNPVSKIPFLQLKIFDKFSFVNDGQGHTETRHVTAPPPPIKVVIERFHRQYGVRNRSGRVAILPQNFSLVRCNVYRDGLRISLGVILDKNLIPRIAHF
jgi:hypothetical protein